VVLEGEIDRWQIPQGLVRSSEVVFDEPFRQAPVELRGIGGHVAEVDKFILDSSVESLINRIVFWGLKPRPVMLKI
jgi:hypothetical protein